MLLDLQDGMGGLIVSFSSSSLCDLDSNELYGRSRFYMHPLIAELPMGATSSSGPLLVVVT